MKVSQWLREYQVTGQPAENCDTEGTELAFWGGWLYSHGQTAQTLVVPNPQEAGLQMAIRAAEFIESRVRE